MRAGMARCSTIVAILGIRVTTAVNRSHWLLYQLEMLLGVDVD